MNNEIMEYIERISDFVKKSRIELELTQAELANIAGISPRSLSSFESGASSISLPGLVSLIVAIERTDILDASFPAEYTSPILEMRKQKLKSSLHKNRVRKSTKKSKKLEDDSGDVPFKDSLASADTINEIFKINKG